MKPGDERTALSEYIDHLRENRATHIPPGIRLGGDDAVSAWEYGFNSALLLIMQHVLELDT